MVSWFANQAKVELEVIPIPPLGESLLTGDSECTCNKKILAFGTWISHFISKLPSLDPC